MTQDQFDARMRFLDTQASHAASADPDLDETASGGIHVLAILAAGVVGWVLVTWLAYLLINFVGS